jgi:DNA mismatch endonuclease (patch repair protein)
MPFPWLWPKYWENICSVFRDQETNSPSLSKQFRESHRMGDIYCKAKRSEVMSRVRSRGNRSTELVMVSLLRTHRISGWRRHLEITGRPDLVFVRERVAVFVDGCFWHACPQCGERPVTNRKFWETKLSANRKRDQKVNRLLKAEGWKVLRIWEHALSNRSRVLARLHRLLSR